MRAGGAKDHEYVVVGIGAQAEAYATEFSLRVEGVAGFVFADLVAEVGVDGF
jgi:hypothetical protein